MAGYLVKYVNSRRNHQGSKNGVIVGLLYICLLTVCVMVTVHVKSLLSECTRCKQWPCQDEECGVPSLLSPGCPVLGKHFSAISMRNSTQTLCRFVTRILIQASRCPYQKSLAHMVAQGPKIRAASPMHVRRIKLDAVGIYAQVIEPQNWTPLRTNKLAFVLVPDCCFST